MENTRLTRLDSWLSIGQKIAVIAGLIVSGWFFIPQLSTVSDQAEGEEKKVVRHRTTF